MSEASTKAGGFDGAFLPPDGGWGWMVVCGSALSHMFIIPILQNFTLIFKDRFTELGFTSTDITTLVSLNASFGMILGLLNGPLLKIFGYRKMALLGLTLYIIGLFCTGIARSYVEFIVFYGLISSFGMALEMASFSFALNSYFLKNRSKAVGYTMTLTGVGPVLFPFLISHLLTSYGVQGAVFLLSGLSLHAFIGAFLLQPVKWHMKLKSGDGQRENKEENKIWLSDVHLFLEMSIRGSKISLPSHSADSSFTSSRSYSQEFTNTINKEDTQERSKPRKLSVTFLDNDDYKSMMNSTLLMIERIETSEKNLKYASIETLGLENFPPVLDEIKPKDKNYSTKRRNAEFLFQEKRHLPQRQIKSNEDIVCDFLTLTCAGFLLVRPRKRYSVGGLLEQAFQCLRSIAEPLELLGTISSEDESDPVEQDDSVSSKNVKLGLFFKLFRVLKNIYDLELLRDPFYLNIMLGLSLAFVGEVIFSTMNPMIWRDIGFSTKETALFMSIIAGSDLLCRFIAPFVGKKLNLNSKKMYLISLLLLLISRSSMYLASTYKTCFLISFALGVGKGFRSVFWVLVLPDYVPLSKLPSASAFQSLINGISILVSGPLIGAVIGLTKSYLSIILASNVLTLTTIVLWCSEIIYVKCKTRN